MRESHLPRPQLLSRRVPRECSTDTLAKDDDKEQKTLPPLPHEVLAVELIDGVIRVPVILELHETEALQGGGR